MLRFNVTLLFILLLTGCTDHLLKVEHEATSKYVYSAECRSPKISSGDIEDAFKFHIIDIRKEGQYNPISYAVTCDGKHSSGKQAENMDSQVESMLKALHGGNYKNILIYIHGGLVGQEEGIEEAIALTKLISKDPDPQVKSQVYYPIIITWRSGGKESYFDQLFKVRSGEINEPLALATSPLKLGSDLGRGIMDTPLAAGLEGERLLKSLRDQFNTCCPSSKSPQVICPELDDDLLSAGKTAAYTVFTPVRIATAPLINGFGRSAWEGMVRQTRAAFWRDKTRDKTEQSSLSPNEYHGAIYQFFKKLNDHLQNTNTADPIKLTLIGHSMGTILITEAVRSFPKLPYSTIVFMGAAVSIRDFSNAMMPLLEAPKKKSPDEDGLKFYNLSLLPIEESQELAGYGILPSGSLLEWVDEMYTSPPNLADRTLGKWVNIREVIDSFPETAKNNMTFRVFGNLEKQPVKHGEFNDKEQCFWRKSFWTATGTNWKDHVNSCNNIWKDIENISVSVQ